MSIKNPIKKTNVAKIKCNETFQITLGITGAPNLNDNPADIILILDKSSSMIRDKKLENMKEGANNQLDIITKATGGILNNKIGGKSRVGLVTFSTDAMLEVPLTNDVNVLKQTIKQIAAEGLTNHSEAFSVAVNAFENDSTNDKIIIMFTDGALSDGSDPVVITDAAKESGIEIYCIGVENAYLNFEKWASKPVDKYIAYSQSPSDLASLFVDIGNRIASTGATNSKIIETINNEFKIVNIDAPTFGNIKQINDTTIEWDINKIGENSEENASVTFTVEYIGTEDGIKKINKNIEYMDDENNIVVFPDPIIEVECKDMDKVYELCPEPLEFIMNGCQDAITVNLNDTELESLGRMIQLNTIIKKVCPNKRVAVAVQLVEVDNEGKEYPRGLKFFTIPAHTKETCTDIELKCVRFVVPENLDESNISNNICKSRKFRAYVMANYIDTDFKCCATKAIM